MLTTGAKVLSADPLRDLLLIAYQGQLYVQPTPDAEPLAVFDAQEVQRTLAAEGENRQTLAAALVAIRLGHAVRRFGGARSLATAYTLLAAAEAMAAARLLLPPLGGPAGLPAPRQAGLAAALEAALRATFAQLEAGQTVALQLVDEMQLVQARAAIALALAVAGAAVDQDVMAPSTALRAGDAARLADRKLQASRREERPC